MKRVVIPELLDSDDGTPAEIAAGLRDLGRINRWLGGVSTSADLIRRVAERSGRRELRVLEVAAGNGELPEAVRHRLAPETIRVDFTLLDRSRSHLNGARNAVVADALVLPFRDQSFELVASSLFLHHLEPDDVVRFVNEALRVARLAVLINDLRRSSVHLAAVCAGLPLFRSRMTRHDSIASVRRAYTLEEARALLLQTQASQVDITEHFLFRMGAIAWR